MKHTHHITPLFPILDCDQKLAGVASEPDCMNKRNKNHCIICLHALIMTWRENRVMLKRDSGPVSGSEAFRLTDTHDLNQWISFLVCLCWWFGWFSLRSRLNSLALLISANCGSFGPVPVHIFLFFSFFFFSKIVLYDSITLGCYYSIQVEDK